VKLPTSPSTEKAPWLEVVGADLLSDPFEVRAVWKIRRNLA